MSSFVDKVRPALEPGEELRYVMTAQTGIHPSVLWVPFARMIVALNRPRILAFTDRRIAVMSAGQLRWARTTPKRVLFSLPRSTQLDHGAGAWSRVTVGDEHLWIARNSYAILDEANRDAATM